TANHRPVAGRPSIARHDACACDPRSRSRSRRAHGDRASGWASGVEYDEPDCGSRTPDPGSRIPDPGNGNCRSGGAIMTFVLKMIARELRASWRRLLFFFICVAIGVAAIVTLRSIIQSVRTGLMREARGTIASDVLIQSSRSWTPDVRADLEQV